MGQEVEASIKLYDEDIKTLASRLAEHDDLFKKDKRWLVDLKERFEKVDQERTCIENEEAIAEARRTKQEAEKERRNQSSALVQAFWRGILQREDYQVMKKK